MNLDCSSVAMHAIYLRRFKTVAPAATKARPKPVKDAATTPVLGKTE